METKKLILTKETAHKKKKIKKLFKELKKEVPGKTEKKTLEIVEKCLITLTALF